LIPSKFSQQIEEIADDDLLLDLQIELLKNPEKGDLIPHSDGLRKIRMKIKGMGKRGGARVIYLYFKIFSTIFFLQAYTKNTKIDLTQNEIKQIKKLINTIKNQIKESHENKKRYRV
jgi:hypothetical protein